MTRESYADMLYPLVESSLPDDTLQAWQRSQLSRESNDDEQLANLMLFLEREVEAEARIKLARDGFTSRGQIKSHIEERPTHTAAGLHHTSMAKVKEGQENRPKPLKYSKFCLFCEGSHESDRCIKAQGWTLEERRAKVHEKKRCFCCLAPNHGAKFCRMPVSCPVCTRRHFALLCPSIPSRTNDRTKSEVNPDSTPVATMAAQTRSPKILLQTMVVTVTGLRGSHKARLLFDSGAQRSYIKEEIALRVGALFVEEERLSQAVFGASVTAARPIKRYKFSLRSLNNNTSQEIEALGQKKICDFIPKLESGPWLRELSAKKIWINDMTSENTDVDVIIGCDYYGSLLTGKTVKLECGLTAIETTLGWTVFGETASDFGKRGMAMAASCLAITNFDVSDLWKLEVVGITDPIEVQTREERERICYEQFLKTVKRDDEGRYEVSLPWINNKISIPDNFSIAEKRLSKLTQRLKLSNQFIVYHHMFEEWEREDLIERVQGDNRRGHYLPHRPVFKLESTTTPVRPVFDASCKTTLRSSLNDHLEKGPNFLQLVPSMILKFRENRIGLVADIRRAFMMIKVNPDDRDYLRFLWWKTEDAKELLVYRHKRVVFGVNCSPFLLNAVIAYHLDNAAPSSQKCAQVLKKSLYVDNCILSVDSVEEMERFKVEATELLSEAKMDLRMWENSIVSNDESAQNNASQVTNLLGLKWNRVTDTLSCLVPPIKVDVLSKRQVLSVLNGLYDPIGILVAATIVPRMLLQQLWVAKVGWDEEVPVNVKTEFMRWASQVQLLATIELPRWITGNSVDFKDCVLHIFCDSSKSAYATVIFLTYPVNNNECAIRFVQAKARVCPLKPTSIPRLELMGCLIGVRLANSVKAVLPASNLKCVYWSDSTTALAWIKKNQSWSVFVQNRVAEILKHSSAADWNYVPSGDNPADLPSRGCTPEKLLELRWWEGPKWLGSSQYSFEPPQVDEGEVESEMRKTPVALVMSEKSVWSEDLCKRVVNYSKLLRVVSWIKRFVCNARGGKISGALTAREMNEAEMSIMGLIQKESKDMLNHGKSKMRTVVDENGIIRVLTKIARRDDSYDFKYPILLPSKHIIVNSLIRECHTTNSHAGTQVMMNKLRERFWILRSRKTIKSIREKCISCRRYEAKSFTTDAAPLPKDRVEVSSVFQTVGIDLGGPMYLKDNSKCWFAVFTCAVYRAIHIELVISLSTEGFLRALRRFIARRGRPAVIYSDNGTNFKGAENEFRALDWNKISSEYATQRIHWKFIPPTAAWWGGWWERMVQSIKKLLVRVSGRSLLHYEELLTIVCDVEATINERPLTYVSEVTDDLRPLTPAMFLRDNKSSDVTDLDHIDSTSLNKRLKYLNRLKKDLRSRFRKEYLSLLVQRSGERGGSGPKLGDVIIVGNDNTKRGVWPLAQIIECYPGPDGVTRVVRLRTSSGELVRPVQRCFLLEGSEFIPPSLSVNRVKPDIRQPVAEMPADEKDKGCPTRSRVGREVVPPKRLDL